MDLGLLLGLAAIGAVIATLGFLLLRAAMGDAGKERLERPPVVEKTDAYGRKHIIERSVYLALELSRVDGAIDETEIAAIEQALAEGIVAVPAEEAQRLVHQALRSTIRQSELGEALAKIAQHADQGHRRFVIEMLTRVADADAPANRDEELFLDRVRRELGAG